jgi:hypothetical protein
MSAKITRVGVGYVGAGFACQPRVNDDVSCSMVDIRSCRLHRAASGRGSAPDNSPVRRAAGQLAWLQLPAYGKNRLAHWLSYPLLMVIWLVDVACSAWPIAAAPLFAYSGKQTCETYAGHRDDGDSGHRQAEWIWVDALLVSHEGDRSEAGLLETKVRSEPCVPIWGWSGCPRGG